MLYLQFSVRLLLIIEVAVMLELIVLGEVPGTQVIITFSWVIAIISVATGTVLLRRTHKQREISDYGNVEDKTL